LKAFPMPYVLTNCHTSLCAVGGTINEDDHAFALSAAKKYGGTYVPTNMAVIHSYNREEMTGCGRMILGSDSHTRYGALGTMAVGEGGGELAKQLLGRTWDLDLPEVTGVLLTGKPRRGVGPQDVAIAFIKAVFQSGFVKNRVVEFIGEGVRALPVEYRNGIDVMTTETTCLSSIWATDEAVRDYYRVHGREEDYQPMAPAELCYYDRLVEMDLSEIEPMIALPFHPSNAYTLREFIANAKELLQGIEDEALRQYPGLKLPRLADKAGEQGVRADQAIVAGCAGGTYDNLCAVRSIMKGHTPGNDSFTFSVYPGSQPTNLAISRNGVSADLMESGVLVREAFCGPCFGAGDTPANGAFSIRHTTRNFINREGSKPGDGQLSFVALMDARSIAATARNGGILTPADEIDFDESIPPYQYDKELYQKRVFKAEKPDPDTELVMGPNIKDWPVMPRLKQHLLIKTASSLHDPVTTTDELIPSGETSSYRSNPLRLAEFTLSRRDPGYTGRAKAIDKDRLALD
ncbi:MAG: hydratase, partial [Clostridiales bacterium]|nr:hydratase [Clostridiales bacterium]